MNCYRCGSPLPEESTRCPFCGAEAGFGTEAYTAYTSRSSEVSGDYTAYQMEPGRVTGSYGPFSPENPAVSGTFSGTFAAPRQTTGGYSNPYTAAGYGSTQQNTGAYDYSAYQQDSTDRTSRTVPPQNAQPKRARIHTQYGEYTRDDQQGYRQPEIYGRDMGDPGRESVTMAALSELPGDFFSSLRDPGALLRSILEKKDSVKALLAAVLCMALVFLSAMAVSRGFINQFFLSLGNFLGYTVAKTQGVNSAAWRVAPVLGGITVLWSFLSCTVLTEVYLGYLCGIRKVNFTWELAYGFITVGLFPIAPAALVCMLLSFLSPWLTLPVILCTLVIRLFQADWMTSSALGQQPPVLHRLLMAGIAALLMALLCGLICGPLAINVLQNAMAVILP